MQEVKTLVASLGPFTAGRRILWVDNYPANNRWERSVLVGWGVDVQTRRSTEEAMIELEDASDSPFDLVISDWFRGGQPEGQRLGQVMRDKGIQIPIVFYFEVSRDHPQLFDQIRSAARAIRAVGATSSPRELLRWTFAELIRAALRDPATRFAV